MEKAPEFRIIGGASEEKKKEAKKETKKALLNHLESLPERERMLLEKLEYPKSEKELTLIQFANQEGDRLMEKTGIEPYDLPLDNYHIVPPELYKKLSGGEKATAFYKEQKIIFDAQCRDNPIMLGLLMLHETLHLKGHLTLEVEENGEETRKTAYRQGVTIQSLQRHGYHGKYHRHFDGLHEAIIETQSKNSFQRLLELPILEEEKKWLMSEEAKDLRRKIAEKEEISEDEIVYVNKKEEKDFATFSYLPHRQVLDYLCEEIQKEFADQYQTPDDVFKEFLKAHLLANF